ncbi:MAG: alpha/beta hydrolase [Gammaproteobacteria bacterium CG11_big_fil_rev_8_21_14_0_20_46_22]|nr:MAG: alpha/beta hydrolase [Gammaproteobacteria bacterium CG12_big_fil_rev_8_21_14_0_65_46_12]PIR11417.1 MAG: alpha/beta hydrolase [Gammaproteobacteria bacterium CG11_big_fil_rev_8_21_14_0_20_46_22]
MLVFNEKETEQFVVGPAGGLQLLTLSPQKAKNALAIVCHPHPLYQGTMRNKVVFTMAKAFHDLGLKTVRFNYRGVEQSEGSYGEGIGETADAMAVIAAAKAALPDHDLYLAGFSFGTFVAASACNQLPETKGLLTVAPSMEHFDFTPLTAINCPWLIAQGTEDEVISAPAVYAFAKENAQRVTLETFEGVGHFFHGHLNPLRETIKTFFEPIVNT